MDDAEIVHRISQLADEGALIAVGEAAASEIPLTAFEEVIGDSVPITSSSRSARSWTGRGNAPVWSTTFCSGSVCPSRYSRCRARREPSTRVRPSRPPFDV